MKTLMTGIKAMVENDGRESNETVFWQAFRSDYGDRSDRDQGAFDRFYRERFDELRTLCGFNPAVPETIRTLRDMGYSLVLATNPLFPRIATQKRAHWAGADLENFEWVTTYENSSFCKPNVSYYQQIADKLGVDPKDCLMVGNDVREDMVARKIGMDVFLLTDCLINRDGEDVSAYPHGSFTELLDYIRR